MRQRLATQLKLFAALLCLPSATLAYDDPEFAPPSAPPHVECVPVARQISGIQIYGNALSWWGQADGRYDRGHTPRRGAVLAFRPHGAMVLGHVAAVSKVIDDRTVLVTHANWSLINGRRGQVERNVEVRDVSDAGDWSRVRVWYAPLGGLGTTEWPVEGFIYPNGAAPRSEPAAPEAPKLRYARLDLHDDPVASAYGNAPAPTGRLSYLGRVLPTL